MPRKATYGSEAQRLRQRRYRDRLAATGCPEASAVDVAVALAVARYAGELRSNPKLGTSVLKMILNEACRQLVGAGYRRDSAKRVLLRRVGRFYYGSSPAGSREVAG